MDDWLKAVLALGVLFVAAPILAMLFLTPMLGGTYGSTGGMHGGGMYGSTGGMHGGGMYGPMGGAYGGSVLLRLAVPLVVLLALCYGGYRLLRAGDGEDAALRELREAYARGDLTTEEYEERRERLDDSRE
ncbi:hypothetical protein MBEHAL_0570 [Halarchaeum acidiphilum MH1-52-1]|uniref:SHOCT domain-containing protein n=1 Tax=Halarchaeum acidiphilum MH1-52-1 TaxID=1261545 RepID=U2YS57_9EURY|nr:SHOCT domain-containing protein [Halarchaeum acidiphilum]GAD51810.1 hypothetical protein MBEHAL_0570 [Halarchaeum acidiphilum MH1-52-1]